MRSDSSNVICESCFKGLEGWEAEKDSGFADVKVVGTLNLFCM